jgi:ribosomal protein S27AE
MIRTEWADPGAYSMYEGLMILCPECGTDDVVLEYEDGYLEFYQCNKCGYKKE